jgi:hypothetical protein
MTDFVLQEEKKGMQNTDRHLRFERILKYAKFLKLPLQLGFFIPCDDEGNVLEEPNRSTHTNEECEQYQQAKERVIFDCVKIDNSHYKDTKRVLIDLDCQGGFRLYNKHIYHDGTIEEKFLPNFSKTPTIEYLIQFNLTITPNAVKTYQL